MLHYAWGFSWKGLLLFMLVMLPNLLYIWIPAPVAKKIEGPGFLALTIVEHGSQALFVVLLLFLTSTKVSPLQSPYLYGMGLLLLAYYVLWGLFFAGMAGKMAWMALAILPVIYFMLAALWLHNFPALLPTVIFGAAHAAITWQTYNP
ncbi:hypothetical protein A7K91_00725 [Paenibacillus oryzae]|uniref:Uncharacterized protein n=1 Tax=Paenibacillus oryzae TaxID=1844972 RepID=A0A1A5Y9D9_9BACL|nr:hypothetical protein [Paenibacillus oryzae]OBR62188.1 hypothetical protein A7K91_00725 [Paenibacillus oryzae]